MITRSLMFYWKIDFDLLIKHYKVQKKVCMGESESFTMHVHFHFMWTSLLFWTCACHFAETCNWPVTCQKVLIHSGQRKPVRRKCGSCSLAVCLLLLRVFVVNGVFSFGAPRGPLEEEVPQQPETHIHKTACVCFHPSTFT